MVKRVQDLAEEVLQNRSDRDYDTYLKGMIRAYREMLEPQAEETLPNIEMIEEAE
jgi:hypothetical protein